MLTWSRVAQIGLLLSAFGGPGVQAQAKGKLDCEAQENGAVALASFRVLADETQISKGMCGRPIELPPGRYAVTVALDGAADAPEQTQFVEVKAGATGSAKVKFETGEIVVEITRDGRRGVGTVRLLRGMAVVATLTAGVPHRISSGTYGVEIESRGARRTLPAVTISRGELRTIRADLTSDGAQPRP